MNRKMTFDLHRSPEVIGYNLHVQQPKVNVRNDTNKIHLPNRNINLKLQLFFTFLIFLVSGCIRVSGELCWSYQDSDQLCRDFIMHAKNKEECCSINSVSVAYTVKGLNTDRLFLWNFVENTGAPNCQRCHTNCSTVSCPLNKKCVLDDQGFPECLCDPNCTDEMKISGPLCGSDIRTYTSTCDLLLERCMNGKNVELEYYGECKNSCKEITCPHGKYCVPDQNTLPHCISCENICSANETMAFREICGTDNVTYNSMCSLRRANCETGKNIGIGYEGTCKRVRNCSDNVICPDQQTCLEDQTAVTNVRCLDCQSGCLESGFRICGSNLKTYDDWCVMQNESCTKGSYIEAIHLGHCIVDMVMPSFKESVLKFKSNLTVNQIINDTYREQI